MPDEDATGAGLWAMAHLGTPMAIRVAATLRIADHIVAGQHSAAELAEATGTHPDALDRLLRYLAARRVLDRTEEGRYSLAPKGDALRDDHPAKMRQMLDIESAVGRAELAFVQLMHSVRTGRAAYPEQFGADFWTDMSADPERVASFDARMSAHVPQRGEVIDGYDWGSLTHLVDVGGGDGTLLGELLTAHPTLRATLVDQPDTAETARKNLAAAGVAERAEAIGGDFFAELPAGADAYLLSLIIHDWDDESSRAILRRCAEAAGPGGRVLVVEDLGADGESPHTGMDLRMLVYYGGKERGLGELTELGTAAGLTVAAVHPAGALSIVEFTAG